jgi:hypothetical protein
MHRFISNEILVDFYFNTFLKDLLISKSNNRGFQNTCLYTRHFSYYYHIKKGNKNHPT